MQQQSAARRTQTELSTKGTSRPRLRAASLTDKRGEDMRRYGSTVRRYARLLAVVLVAVAFAVPVATAGPGAGRAAVVALPSGNTVEQWNKIAEDTIVGSGAFQIEGFIYMAYESTAVYDATVALRGGYEPLMPAFRVWKGASPDAAVVEAAYRTLTHYFPAASTTLDPLYAAALPAIPDGRFAGLLRVGGTGLEPVTPSLSSWCSPN